LIFISDTLERSLRFSQPVYSSSKCWYKSY